MEGFGVWIFGLQELGDSESDYEQGSKVWRKRAKNRGYGMAMDLRDLLAGAKGLEDSANVW